MSHSATLKKAPISAEDLLSEALEDQTEIKEEGIRLLTSGYKALREWQGRPLNQIELNAIQNLVDYVAHTQKVTQETVSQYFMAQYNIEEIEALPQHLFMDAMEFLVDLEMNKVMN